MDVWKAISKITYQTYCSDKTINYLFTTYSMSSVPLLDFNTNDIQRLYFLSLRGGISHIFVVEGLLNIVNLISFEIYFILEMDEHTREKYVKPTAPHKTRVNCCWSSTDIHTLDHNKIPSPKARYHTGYICIDFYNRFQPNMWILKHDSSCVVRSLVNTLLVLCKMRWL